MKFLKTLRKRGLALFLVLTMCMSLLPTQAMAAEGDGRNPDGSKVLNPKPGEVQADKYYTKNDNGTYTLHLKVKGGAPTQTSAKSTADVVLIVDNSGSMSSSVGKKCNTPKDQFKKDLDLAVLISAIGYVCPNCHARYYYWGWGHGTDARPEYCTGQIGIHERMETAKEVSKTFAADILSANNDNRLAVIGFSSDSNKGGKDNGAITVNSGLTNEVSTVNSAVSRMEANGGTNYTAAFVKAKEILDSRTADERANRKAYVVFISDGGPGLQGTSHNDSNWNGSKQIADLKADGVTIYTIGIALDDNGTASAYLQSLASEKTEDHYRNVTGEDFNVQLKEILGQWAAQINTVPAGRGANMTDVISGYFDIAKDSNGKYMVSDNLAVDEDGRTVRWNIGEINTGVQDATITIVAKPNAVGDNLPTNEKVELKYTDGNGVEQTIPTDQIGDPKVDIPPSKPNDKDLEEIIPGPKDETPESPAIAGKVQVVCDNAYANHQPQTFGWTAGKANEAGVVGTVTKVNGEYQVTVTLRASDYTGRYAPSDKHTQVTDAGKNQDVTLTLKWDSEAKAWTRSTASDGFDAIFHVNCDHKGYTVSYNGNGNTSGTAPVDNTRYAENASATIQGQGTLVKTGYTFAGWKDADGNAFASNTQHTMTSNLILYAQWNPSKNTAYTVKHYVEDLPGTEHASDYKEVGGVTYSLRDTDGTLRGTTGTLTNAQAKTYTGFTATAFDQKTIAEDGSTVVEILYTRNKHSITYVIDGSYFTNDSYRVVPDVPYGQEIVAIDAPAAQAGYVWKGWGITAGQTMPDENLTISGHYEPATDTQYKVKHYLENIADNEYTLDTTVTAYGTTGQQTTAQANSAYANQGFVLPTSITQKAIAADGTTEIDVYYTRARYTVTYEITGTVFPEGVTAGVKTTISDVKHGTPASSLTGRPTDSEMAVLGYTWSNWSTLPKTITGDVTVSGSYGLAGDTEYKVFHHYQNVSGNDYTSGSPEVKSGVTLTDTAAEANVLSGFYLRDGSVTQEPIAPDGSTEIHIYYDRNLHTITYKITAPDNLKDDQYAVFQNVRYGATIADAGLTLPTNDEMSKQGYDWSNWSQDLSVNDWTMPDADVEVTGAYTARNDTKFNIVYWQQNLEDDQYTKLKESESAGVTGELTDVSAEAVTGFTAKEIQQAVIAADGSTVINVYYDRNTYTVTYEITGSFFTDSDFAKFENVKYGAAVPQPTESTEKEGYTFSGWHVTPDGEMPDSVKADLHFTGSYAGNAGIQYTVEHYLETLTENQYAAPETETKVGTAGAETEAVARNYPGFTAQSFDQVDIAGDNSTVVKIYYTRNSYAVSYDPNGGTAPGGVSYEEESFRFDSDTAIKAAPVREGYAFLYWTDETGKQYNPGEVVKMPAGNLALTANWRPTAARVSVTKVLSSVNGNAYADGSLVNVGDTLVYTITVTNISTMTLTDVAVTDPLTRDTWTVASLAPNASDRHEVTYVVDEDDAGNQITNTAVASSDDTVDVPGTEVIPVNARYTVTYTDGVAGEEIFADQSYTLNAGAETPAFAGGTPVREGYTFNGWSPAVADTVTGSVTYTAQWTANTPTPVPPIVVPPVTIPDGPTPLAPGGDTILDDEVPLAAPGLNSTDHFDYVKGYEDGTVRPEANITRAEVATIFFRLMTQEYRMENWSTENSFSDVTVDTWYNNAISTATKAGILTGYPEGDFRPEKPITRAEFASIAARFASEEVTQRGRFSDIQGHWAEENIERAAAAGWVKGENGKFRPEAYITRAEVITAVNRMLDRVPDADHLLDGMKTFVDNVPGMWYYADVQEATNSHDYERDETGINEVWTELKPDQDWTALEKEWADAAAANVAGVAANLNGGSESEGETEGESATKTEG